MYKLRPSSQRGETKTDWLDSKHTFSFANYYDINNTGFSDLRVINDDILAPSGGFGLHPHSNMEIISIVLQGALEHVDSMGNKSIINKGDVQKMSAGIGIYHSEYNPSSTNFTRFLQIWIFPDTKDLKPYYEQKSFDFEKNINKLILIASKNSENSSIKINQDVKLYQCIISKDKSIEFRFKQERKYWIQIAEGSLKINSMDLTTGDGLAVYEEDCNIEIKSNKDNTNFLIFDLRS